MKKSLIVLFTFLSICSRTFACGVNGSTSLATSNNQKACQNVVSFIVIDFSFLSPRATAADLNVGMPKRCMPWMHKCCTPQCYTYESCAPQCCTPQTCPQACAPQCCPCTPQCPNCKTQSMKPDDNKLGTLRPKSNEQEAITTDTKQDGLVPVANIQESEQQCMTPKTKTSMFRIDLFRRFKFQIL